MWFAVQLDESVPSLRHDDDRRSGFGIKSPKSTSKKKWIWKIHLRPENCHLSVSLAQGTIELEKMTKTGNFTHSHERNG